MRLRTEIIESARMALDALRANKLRSGLATLGVVIGIVTVTLMGTAINGVNKAFRQSISSLGADVLFVGRFPWMAFDDWRLYRNRREITFQDAREVARLLTTASAVSIQANDNGNVVFDRRLARGVWINGNTEQSIVTRGLSIAKGRWFTQSDIDSERPVCVLGAYLADGFFPNESPIGRKVRVNDAQFEVVGVLEKLGDFLGGWNQDNQVAIPVSRFRLDIMPRPDYEVAVKAADPASLQETLEETRSIMRRIRRVEPGRPDDFAINQQDVFVRFFLAFGGTIGAIGLFITGLALVVGGIGIMNIMFVSVAERTREIGVRKALGAKRRSILVQFLMEAAAITLGAGLLALGFAWPVTWAIANFSSFPASMSWWIVAVALAVSASTGVIAGLVPALRASRMNPVDALRSE
jgi:putative ABC transport system permease protein